MYSLDFANPYVIYLCMMALTLITIVWVLRKRSFSVYQKTVLYTLFALLLGYSIGARYIIPYVLDGSLNYPFFPTRMAVILSIIFLVLRPSRMRPLVYFVASTNIIPVFMPMGHPRNIEILNETFIIDHYVGAVMPFLLLRFENYIPTVKGAVLSVLFMGMVIFTFLPLNEVYGFGNYFFMHDDNIILALFDWMTHYHFAALLSAGLFIFYGLYTKLGQWLANGRKLDPMNHRTS